MISLARYLFAVSIITLITCQCTPKLIDQREGSVDIDDQIVYISTQRFLEDQEDENVKYISFQKGSFEIEEEASNDIREVAVYKDIHAAAKINIIATDEEVSIKRAEQIKLLMTHFGIDQETITIVNGNHIPTVNDNVIMIKVLTTDGGVKDIALSN